MLDGAAAVAVVIMEGEESMPWRVPVVRDLARSLVRMPSTGG